MKKQLLLSLLILTTSAICNAKTGYAIKNSFWSNATTWSFDGVNRVPACGDTIIIPSGKSVTVNSQQNYAGCANAIVVIVEGTLQITNGNKLDLPCNSCVNILENGLLKKATAGGGTSTLLGICGYNEWIAAQGPLPGPVSLCNALPVTLLYFEAKSVENSVDIAWTTASEINNDHFIVERSIDGSTFNEVTKARGAGNSSNVNEYSATDYYPASGLSYYRLKQVDFDGAVSYSDIVAVMIKEKSAFEFINVESTMNSTVKLSFTANTNEVYSLQMHELNGSVVFSLDVNVTTGLNNKEIYCPFLKKGIYTLTLSGAEKVLAKKIAMID